MEKRNDYLNYIIEHIPLAEACEKLGIHIQRRQLLALCPFHHDKHPSLRIYQDHFHCYACQAHGNIFDLVKEVRGVDFPGALSWLEESFPYILNQKPAQYSLGRPEKKPLVLAKAYYDENKGNLIQETAIKRGYTPAFLSSVGVCETNGSVLCRNVSPEELAGLLQAELILNYYGEKGNESGYRDYFSTNRLLFTIQDTEHRITGFAGRSTSDEDGPKYLYTKGLPKSNLLYRLNAVIARRSKPERTGELCSLYLVEGFFDALRLESLGIDAVAVMGSHPSDQQMHLLEQFVVQQGLLERTVELVCFLDSDRAGVEGAYQVLKSVWRSDTLRHTPLSITVDPSHLLDLDGYGKDPDEILKGKESAEAKEWLASHQFHPMEFLLRYFLNSQTLLCDNDMPSLARQWEELSFPHRVRIINQVANLFSQTIWADILAFYQGSGKTEDAQFVLQEFDRCLLGRPVPSMITPSISVVGEGSFPSYALALEMARSGYQTEAMPMDTVSWDRLQAGIDLIEQYDRELLSRRRDIRHVLRYGAPMLGFYMPKDEEKDRLKALPDHETLVRQHYILNELLQEDVHAGYARMIPAVRYDLDGPYTTGADDMDTFADTPYKAVSFAYQVDMQVLRGNRPPVDGLFRHYYDCWKDFISFLQEGIHLLDGEYIYRAKLDIRGYYDNIQKRTVRDVLTHPLTEAFGFTQSKFQALCLGENKQQKAEAVMDLLLEGLFGWSYIDPQTGKTMQVEDPLVGIPQGPALSAYAANVLLFPLDRAVSQYVNEINAQCAPEHIRIRYARYVDDMVILTTDRTALADAERIIQEQLYKLGLELSPKTDHPDAVDKEEAHWWLVDQRGGFGVSASHLAPEDTLDELWGMGGEPYAVNRRDALNILKGARDILDSARQEQFDEAFLSCFKTEEIRYRDSVRLSAFLLEHLISLRPSALPGELYEAFMAEWKRGQEEMGPLHSILCRPDLGPMAFLDGLALLLERRISLRISTGERERQEEIRKAVAYAVAGRKDIDLALEAYDAASLQHKNSAFLRLRVVELDMLALGVPTVDSKTRQALFQISWKSVSCGIVGDGFRHYLQRWQYMLSELDLAPDVNDRPILLDDFPDDFSDEFQMFHFLTTCLGQCAKFEWFQELASLFSAHTKNIQNDTQSILYQVERLWFLEEEPEDSALAAAALQSLSNFLHWDYLPDVICQRPAMCHALFAHPDRTTQELSYLPVPPGVRYSGIFAMGKMGDIVYRADFDPNLEQKGKAGVPDLVWQPVQNAGLSQWSIYRSGLVDTPWKGLSSPLQEGSEHWTPAIVEKVVSLYEELCRLFDAPKAGYILSKYHLFRSGDGTIHAISYYSCGADAPSGVALAGQSPFLKWKYLDGKAGRTQRAAAFLLEDLLWLRQYPVNQQNAQILEILSYALDRLTGRRMQKYLFGLSECSFQQTVRRTLCSLRNFAGSGPEETRRILLEMVITDRLMSERMNWGDQDFGPGDAAAFLYLWAVKTFQLEFPRLEQEISSLPAASEATVPLRRITAAWRAIGIRLQHVVSDGCETIRALSEAALMAAVIHDIRTRVLECVWVLSMQERDQLRDRPLPIHRLGLQKVNTNVTLLLNSTKTTEEQAQELCALMLQYRRSRGGPQLEQITPVGWHLLLAWVLELDSQSVLSPRLYRGSETAGKHRPVVLKTWDHIRDMLLDTGDSTEEEFPYDGIAPVLSHWTADVTDKLLKHLCLIDEMLGFEVHRKESLEMLIVRSDRRNGQILLRLDTSSAKKYPTQFVSFFRDSDRMPQYEETENGRVWTQTILGEQILSVSAVTQKIAGLISGGHSLIADASHPQQEAPEVQVSAADASAASSAAFIAAPELLSDQSKAEPIASAVLPEGIPSGEQDSPPVSPDTSCGAFDRKLFRDKLRNLQKAQQRSWALRKNLNGNIDRIALFQFDVDDSYAHPLSECCIHQKNESLDLRNIKRDPTRWNEKMAGKYRQTLYSCAEYRRRKLLEAVFSACETFEVEILLLPEYSIRPETAEWILDEIQRRQYHFSVWAGTCRLTPGRNYESGPLSKLQDKAYDDSALLPIICNKPVMVEAGGEVELLLERFKKYPSISMEELIHPQDKALLPVMKQRKKLFGDARDDVMELICAEVFLATNPGNIIAFTQVYDSLRARFTGTPPDVVRQQEKITEDLVAIGAHISSLQLKESYARVEKNSGHGVGKYGRTPILLVPAYTTRTVDYYVTGQSGYLATGLTTVFCNAASQPARGESCFIGTDCWEREGAQKDVFLPDYSLYHGAIPGIYHQYDTRKGHGALGQSEQALLICDINPAASTVGKPRPESLMQPLTLVAHLPVIESCKYEKQTRAEDGQPCGFYERCRCSRSVVREKKGSEDPAIRALLQMEKLLERLDELGGRGGTSAYDEKPDELYDALSRLGAELGSSGLQERANCYARAHRHSPQSLPPATLLDWLWIDVDYPKSIVTDDWNLDVPSFSETERSFPDVSRSIC